LNVINVITPYRHEGMWVFDDPSVGLHREPFVAGADVMIDVLTKDIPNAEKGFNLVFSKDRFPCAQILLMHVREELGGNVYHNPELEMTCWLCPALLKYFETAPERIYVEIRAKPE
jgi:hypothetical protein